MSHRMGGLADPLSMAICAVWLLSVLGVCTTQGQTLHSQPSSNHKLQQRHLHDMHTSSLSHSLTMEQWNTSWGGFLPDACTTSNSTTLVSWDTSVNPHRCVPDVCGGAVLTDLRDLDGRTSVADICAGPLYDTQRTQACLTGKNVLFLGDSTLQEEVMDIASLLSMLAYNNTALLKLADKLHSFHVGATEASYSLPNNVQITFHGGQKSKGRHFTIIAASLNISLRFRFAGHHNIEGNLEGITSFLHPSFIDEFLCELGVPGSQPNQEHCPQLQALVLNSGQHDTWNKAIPEGQNVETFALHLDKLLAMLAAHQKLPAPTSQTSSFPSNHSSKYHVVWRGNTLMYDNDLRDMLQKLDDVAQARVSAMGIPFIDVAAILKPIPGFPDCCTTTMVHFGTQEYANFVSKNHHRNLFTASSLITNAILRRVCTLPVASGT